MDNTKPNENAKNPGIPAHTVRFAFTVVGQTYDETFCEFSTYFDVPMGLRPGRSAATKIALQALLEHIIKVPLTITFNEYIEKLSERRRKEQPIKPVMPGISSSPETSTPPAEAGHSVLNRPIFSEQPLSELPPAAKRPTFSRPPLSSDSAADRPATPNGAGTPAGKKVNKAEPPAPNSASSPCRNDLPKAA